MRRYYSVRRPVAPGTFPKPSGNRVQNIENFPTRQYCKEIGREAWGYIEYLNPLSDQDAAAYELVVGEN